MGILYSGLVVRHCSTSLQYVTIFFKNDFHPKPYLVLVHTYKHQKIINVQDLIREYRDEKILEKNKRTCTPIR